MRTVSLAEALRDREGLGIAVLSGVHADGDSVVARQIFEAHKIPVVLKPAGKTEEAFIADEIARTKAAALVLDVRTPLNRGTLEGFKSRGLRIVTIDDASDRRLAADLAIYPPVPQAEKLDWRGFNGERMTGPDCVLLSPAIVRASKERSGWTSKAPRVLVSMGGSDPKNLTGVIAAACTRTLGDEMPIDVVIGPSAQNAAELVDWLKKLTGIVIHRTPKNVASLYAQASLAVISFGVTAYELAALGIPALYIALTEDHRQSALGAEKLGFGRLVAMADDLLPSKVAAQAANLLSSPGELAHMSAAGRATVSGEGAERIAQKIAALISRKADDQARSAQSQMPRANLRPAVGE
jgi:spore coat polysaccharide biosynthesis protein SpsF